MSRLSRGEIEAVVKAWASQSRELAAHPSIGAVTIFENRGEVMGASNPHPHGQIWATKSVPNELAREAAHQASYHDRTGRPLLIDYLERELAEGSRIVCANDHFVVLTPFWAAWPFETLLLPRRGIGDLKMLSPEEMLSLAAILSNLTKIYDAVFNTAFPYTMGWHQRPMRANPDEGFVLHAHFYPPLLRSASVRKFMVGFEMLGMPQRDLTPETAAALLREVSARKEAAVAAEEFELAKRLKLLAEQIKHVGGTLATLCAEKARAVGEEDYDKAGQLKGEISRIRDTLGGQLGEIRSTMAQGAAY
jgi:UDPglucose--hexose-1-phosphate uridylyltransferase